MPATNTPACDHVCNAGPASFPEVKDWDSLVMGLSAGDCPGDCPAYYVNIHGDGTVDFVGGAHTAHKGEHHAQILVAAVRALFAKFRAADFFALKDRYAGPITDAPTNAVTLTFDEHSKTVQDYAGSMGGMPKVVGELEAAINAAANTEQWIEP